MHLHFQTAEWAENRAIVRVQRFMPVELGELHRASNCHRQHVDEVSTFRLEFETAVCGVCSGIAAAREIYPDPENPYIVSASDA
jgi:hypothetical protein